MELARKFTERLRDACRQSEDLEYTPARFLQMLEGLRGNGPELARRLIQSGVIQAGLKHAVSVGRADLAVESIMLEPEFSPLFSKDILAAAKWRLDQARTGAEST